jgi:streptomycin 6-kinase
MTTFQDNIISIYSEKGKEWLDNLPKLARQISSRLQLRDLKEVTNLSYNYVLSGFQSNNPIILKLGLDSEALKQEAFALKCFEECGAAKVLAADQGMLLLERAVPGVSLKNYFLNKEPESIEITCKVMKKLTSASIPEAHNFPHIKDWLSNLNKDWQIPSNYLKKARKLRVQLLQNSGRDVLLHGDLHHDNILRNGDDYVVIDPKGVVGEPAYEVAAFIRNPIPDLLSVQNAADIIQNRIAIFSDSLNIPKARIAGWCFVQAVLAWVWAIEDSCDTIYFEQLTRIFDSIHLNM